MTSELSLKSAFTPPAVRQQSIAINVYVCLSVCALLYFWIRMSELHRMSLHVT